MTRDTGAQVDRDPLMEEFLRYLANERNASPRTLKAYRHALTSFRAENKTSWKKCTADDFRNYLFAVMKREQARSYVRLQFSALRTFYQFLAARKRLRHNPVREVQLPKMEKKLPLVLTRQQVDELLAAPTREPKSRSAPSWMPLRDVAIMELFYSSGLRLSELAALDVAEVDPYTESVRVFGKGRKERVCARGCALHQQRAKANLRALSLVGVEAVCSAHVHSDFHKPTQIAPQLRHTHARSRCGSAQRASVTRARESFHDTDLHARHRRTSQESVRGCASAGVIEKCGLARRWRRRCAALCL